MHCLQHKCALHRPIHFSASTNHANKMQTCKIWKCCSWSGISLVHRTARTALGSLCFSFAALLLFCASNCASWCLHCNKWNYMPANASNVDSLRLFFFLGKYWFFPTIFPQQLYQAHWCLGWAHFFNFFPMYTLSPVRQVKHWHRLCWFRSISSFFSSLMFILTILREK